MARATVSPKFQIVIPKEIRERYEAEARSAGGADRPRRLRRARAAPPDLRTARHRQGRTHGRLPRRDRPVLRPRSGCSTRQCGSSTSPAAASRICAARTCFAEREIVTPVQVLYEVYRWTLRHVGEQAAMEIVAHLEFTRFVAGRCHDRRGRRRSLGATTLSLPRTR